MDNTKNFKAAVMTVKVQRKHEFDKNRILPKKATTTTTKQRDEFSKQAKDVLNKITNLRNVLIENRAAYMRIGQHLKSSAQMTDEERDLIDRESEKFVMFYTQLLGQMRSDWKRAKRKAQERQHVEAVIELLVNYLHSVEQIHLSQKKYRLKYELQKNNLLKLADKMVIPVRLASEKKQQQSSNKSDDDDGESETTSEMDWDDNWLDEDDEADEGRTDGERRKTKEQNDLNVSKASEASKLNVSAQTVALDEDIQKSEQLVHDESKDISPEDVQMFEEENVQLYQELQGLEEEVQQIEKNVVDIAQLQDIFTEKVSLQQHNIERIANAVIGATENVKDANEQIKQAIQRNAGLRVWSLFFLLVMSFALLFLDWYYD